MSPQEKNPVVISANDLERLRKSASQLADLPKEMVALGPLLAEEYVNWENYFTEHHCVPGEIFIREDDTADSMYIIRSGMVAIVKGDISSLILIGCRKPGEPVGEMATLEGLPRSASVVALTRVELLEINRENFQELLRSSPSFSEGIMRMLSSRVREASSAVERETKAKLIDSLTGLYNRNYMNSTLEHELHRATRAQYPVSFIMLDIDHFKQLNDTYGHLAGDQVLRSLAEIVKSQVRLADVACRYGGEEFFIILSETPLDVAAQRAEAIRSAFSALSISYQEHQLKSTVSLGVASFPEHGLTPNQLILAVDAALYTAKEGGRNRVAVYAYA